MYFLTSLVLFVGAKNFAMSVLRLVIQWYVMSVVVTALAVKTLVSVR